MTRHLPALFAKSAVCAALTLALVLTGCGGGGSKNIASGPGTGGPGTGGSGILPESGQTFTVTGLAKLGQGSDHSGIVVSLDPVTSAVTRPARAALKLARTGGGGGAVARAASAAPAFSAVTDASGRYTIAGVPGGDYVALAQKDHARKAIHLGYRVGSSTTTLDFVLTPTGDITGTVKDANGAGVGAVTVYIPGTSFIAITDASGAYTITDVPVATYTVAAMKGSGAVSANLQSVVAAQTTTVPDMTLPLPASSGSGDNFFPVFTSNPPGSAAIGVALSYEVTTFDADGHALTLATTGSLPPGLSFTGSVLSGTPTQAGSYTFAVTAVDGHGGNATQVIKLVVSTHPPVFTSNPPTQAVKGNTFSYNPTATDADGHTVTLSLVGTLPPGLSFTGGAVSGTPTAVGTYPFILRADDGNGSQTDQAIELAVTNAVPVITSNPPTQAVKGIALSYTIVASDADGHTLAYSVFGVLPTGITLNGNVLSGTPTATGNYSFTVRASDGQGGVGEQAISLAVINNAPVFTDASTHNWAVNVGAPFSLDLPATDTDGHTVTYSINGTLPAGLALSGSTISGSPTTAGNYTFSIVASDGQGGETSKGILLEVFGFSKISTGQTLSCGLKIDGTVACWGKNGYGQLGNGTTVDSTMPVAVIGFAAGTVNTIAVGDIHACAAKTNGTVACWGENSHGKLGDGTMANQSTPVAVNGLSSVSDIVAGESHTCALKTDGTVVCWGGNHVGQLGNGATVNSSVPVVVSGLSGVSAIAAGEHYTCAKKTDGTAACWGRNENGQLGDGTTANSSVPVIVSGLSSVSQISVGTFHTCAVKSDGTVACWGDGQFGKLGGNPSSPTPAIVSGLSNISQVSVGPGGNIAGAGCTCALKTDGTVSCWSSASCNGGNYNEQPTGINGLNSISKISNAAEYVCSLKSVGTILCWGYGVSGSQSSSSVPVYLAPTRL